MRELDLERRVVARITALGGMAYKFASPSRRGVPDRLCLLPGGRVVFVEVKAPGRKPTALQQAEHERLRALGFDVRVVDSLDEVEALE